MQDITASSHFMIPRDKCVVLVPVGGHIESACETALQELERRGYVNSNSRTT